MSQSLDAPGAGVTAYLGLGSNQGDSRTLLEEAVRGLSTVAGVRVTGLSRCYRTAAVGMEDQPDFLNMIVEIATTLAPLELLEAVQSLESAAGRVRTVRWGPRTLDVDILWYDGIFMDHDRLQLPHPRMQERRFVLEPLAELAPDLVLGNGLTVRESLAEVLDQDVAVMVDPRKE
ncbi:MAG TPA: 2-amino-4-hydroxy-6-hydroxymethyldihydropteridine diphosphokinase [Thermoleophilia bacterium]|nr:2-amino-4-hydroxy-6-hydroxymethyldihydropteridine diphosphokinase [Thermoleophilia bacterium]